MISGGLGTCLVLAYVGARISCKASQDSAWEVKSYLNQLETTDNQAISLDNCLYRTPIPTFHQSDQGKLTSKLQSNFKSLEDPNNPWSSRQTTEILAERNASERVAAGTKNEARTFGVQPSQKDTSNDQLPARCIRTNHPEAAVESLQSHPGPGHETGVAWASIPTDPIRERPSRTQQYTQPPTNAHRAPPNLAVNAFQKFPENIQNTAFLSRSPLVSESHILRVQDKTISGVVAKYPAFPQELLQSSLCHTDQVGPTSRDSRFNVVGEASQFETRINARSNCKSSNDLEMDDMDFLEASRNVSENQSHGPQTKDLKRKPTNIRNTLQPSNDPHISGDKPLSPWPDPKETRATCHNVSQDLSHIGINIVESSAQLIHLSGGSNFDFKPNHTKEKSRKGTKRLKPSHDSKFFNSANPTPGIDPTGNNLVDGESSRSNSVYQQQLEYNGLLEHMQDQIHIETGTHSNKEIKQEVTLNVKQNEIKFFDIFKFDVDAFSKENHQTEEDKDRAELIISFIQKDKPQSSQICLSGKQLPDIWRIFAHTSYRPLKKKRYQKGMTNESKIQHQKELKDLRNKTQADSINHLMSNRGYWHLFWTEKCNIQIFGASHSAGPKALVFVREVTIFMFYIHMISTILGDMFKSETKSNQNILEKAHNFALEFAPKSYHKEKSEKLPLRLEEFKKMKISEIINNKSKISEENKIKLTSCQRSISLVWQWIGKFVKSLNNQYLIAILSTGESHFKMNQFAQAFFNNIFFFSIEKLNKRLQKHYELKI